MHIAIIGGIREIGVENCNKIVQRVGNAFTETFAKKTKSIKISVAIFKDKKSVLKLLKEMGENKNEDINIIYYFGHGDQMSSDIGVKGDEADGKDEIWRLTNGEFILDDDITISLLGKCEGDGNDYPFTLLISDSCSSGTMIDSKLTHPKRKWVSISSCTERQDSLAFCDGGVFTNIGLIPALKEDHSKNIKELIFNCNKRLEYFKQSQNIEIHYQAFSSEADNSLNFSFSS